jgi:hypothetical protein
MDSLDWLLSVVSDPEALRLNAIFLVFFVLAGCLIVAVARTRQFLLLR